MSRLSVIVEKGLKAEFGGMTRLEGWGNEAFLCTATCGFGFGSFFLSGLQTVFLLRGAHVRWEGLRFFRYSATSCLWL